MPQKQYNWECPVCGAQNTDTRTTFVICTGCGQTFDAILVQEKEGK